MLLFEADYSCKSQIADSQQSYESTRVGEPDGMRIEAVSVSEANRAHCASIPADAKIRCYRTCISLGKVFCKVLYAQMKA